VQLVTKLPQSLPVALGGGRLLFYLHGSTSMSIREDARDKLAEDAVALAKAVEHKLNSPAVEAKKALERSFAATALQATQNLSASREFEEWQRKYQAISESSLMKAMRDIESPLLAAVKTQELWPTHLKEAAMGTLRRSDFEEKLLKMESTLAGDFMKKVAAMDSIGDNFLKQLSKMEAAVGRDFSAKLLEASTAAENAWNSSAMKLAQSLANSLPKFDEGIAEALRNFNALGDLQANAATLSGIGSILEAADTVAASGSVQKRKTEPATASDLELWWEKQPIQVKFLFLLLLFIVKSVTDAYIAEHVKVWTAPHSGDERQLIYNQITQNFGADTARRLRCIKASALKVRGEASTTSTIIDSLPHGTAVEILESQGSWSLIRYRVPHSSDIREGWAASGYLSLEIC